jgi:hypothetical protein
VNAASATDPRFDHAAVEAVIQAISSPTGEPDVGGLPEDGEALRALLHSVVPVALERHNTLGISADIAHASLADIDRKIDAYGGSADHSWLLRVLRGDVLAFGRLQFERSLVDGTRAMHIPEGDSLSPESVEDAVAQARAWFGDDQIVCTSWLLDPGLYELGEHSNIVKFARLFDLVEPDVEGDVEPSRRDESNREADHDVCRFVFRRPVHEVLDTNLVVAATSLQRLVAARLRSGQHWAEPRGLLRG